jgi:hypothetical protein
VAFVTAFLSSLAFASSISAKTEPTERLAITAHSWCIQGSDCCVIGNLVIGLPDELGVAIEDDDSTEMSRVDIHDCTFGVDRLTIRLKAPSATARTAHPIISSPLLV